MKIKSMTATFGGLERARLEPGPGLTLIHAPNEGGKSTWTAFLRVMFYGLSTKDRSPNADKRRYQPWSGAPMEGEIQLELELTAGGSDPADAAMLYGQANAALGALWHPLTRAFHVKDGTARVKLDFDAPGTTVYGQAALSIKIGTVVWIGLRAGWKALFRALAARKRLKRKRRKAA